MRYLLYKFTFLCGLLLFLASGSAMSQSPDAAVLANETEKLVRSMICPGAKFSFADIGNPELNRMEPAKIFDNLYQLGMKSVAAWALTTSEGIVLFESMFDYTVEDNVIDYLRRLGLDPADIKYVILTHSHADHYGGAKFLQENFNARIIMSETEWEHLHSSQRLGPSPPPEFTRFDIAVKDGDVLTLGDTVIKFIHTPGHTPGTLSAIFPVTDGDNEHYVGYLGGSGVRGSVQDVVNFLGSVDYLAYYDKRIDVGLSNHPFADGALIKSEALSQRRTGDAHPFVLGNAGYRQWLSVVRECAGEHLAQKISELSPTR